MSYEAWMTAHDQAKHWTVENKVDRAKVGWANATEGYWFTVEITPACPRLKTSWNDLTTLLRLLCLEEYVIAYWTHCDLTDERIDINTWCWLRTRFGLSALGAGGSDGGVGVDGFDSGGLSVAFGRGGGRAVEVVKNAA